MVKRRKYQLAAMGAALLLVAPAHSAEQEKVQIKGSTSIELPKPKHSLEDVRTFRSPESPSGRGEYEGGVAAATPVNNNSPQMDKKLMELLDKKRNWIFVNPYEMQHDSKTEEFMDGEKSTGLFNHRLMKGEEKSVLEKFIDEKNPERENDPEATENGTERSSRKELMSINGNELGEDGKATLTSEKGQTLQFKLEQKASFTPDRSPFQQKLERTPFTESGETRRFAESQEITSTTDLRKDREARDAELSSLFQPRNFASPSSAVGFDPLNNAPDATRQEASPIGQRRPDQFLNFGRSEGSPGAGSVAGGISSGRNSPIFSGAPSASSIPGREASDLFGSKIAQPSTVSSGNSFTPPSATRPTFNQSPFAMPFPQRKF